MILVVGGTGMLGSVVTGKLLERGEQVRVMTRNPQGSTAVGLAKAGAEIVEADLRNPDSLPEALRGVNSVVAAAHAFAGPGSTGDNNPKTVDDAGHRVLIDASHVAGVGRFVYVSVFGAAPDGPGVLWTTKYRVEEYLKASGLTYTILRPGPFMEMWGSLLGGPVLAKGKTTVFGDGTNPINFVAVDDVAEFVLVALLDPNTANTTIDVGGPDNLTMDEVVAVYEDAGGTKAKVTHLPVGLMRTMSSVMKPFNPAMSRQVGAGACMATMPHACDMSETCARFGVTLTPMSDIAKKAAAEVSRPA
jgi:uncharacterized protein YbjT (DUF2867 family)